jgi:dTDP-4-amino-4,6-dideoxygalactose transaminase
MNFNLDTDLEAEIGEAILGVIARRHYINGNELKRFEEAWAHANSLPYAVGVGNGTDAIRIALIAAGVGPGDEVITPAFNAAYAAQAVLAIGARNVYADVDPDTWLLRWEDIAHRVTTRTRAIVPVHLFGQMVDMEQFAAVARYHGLVLVEDAAQVHGARYRRESPGAFSDAACYSHYPTKNLGCLGEGGSITTRLPIIAQRARLLRDAGRTDRYVHMLHGINSGLDEIQAAVLNVRLPYLLRQNTRRGNLAARYREQLAGVGDLRFQKIDPEASMVNHLFVVRTHWRKELVAHLKKQDIPAISHYPCVLPRQPFAVADTLDQGVFPNSEAVANEVLSLPLWPSMTYDEQDFVVAAIKSFPW